MFPEVLSILSFKAREAAQLSYATPEQEEVEAEPGAPMQHSHPTHPPGNGPIPAAPGLG